MLRLETRVLLQLIQKASQHQSGANQQYASQAHFCYHKDVAQFSLAGSAHRSTPSLMQALPGIDARSLQRGRQPKHDAGEYGDEKRKSKYRPIHMNLARSREPWRQQRNQHLDALNCQ